MKEQKTIKDIQTLSGLCKFSGDCMTCDICYKAVPMAIEALEKQIPKKVIFEDDGEVLLCPRCNFDLMGSITDPDHDPYYCFECGQALDWKVDE